MAGYRLYGLLYGIFSLLPVDGNRAYFIMTHDSSDEGNCGVMKTVFEKRGFRCDALTRSEASGAGFIFRSAYRLARSRFIFCDNTFLPLAFLKLRKGSALTQLWHGTGTIKKFGQDVNEGELKDLEARCGRNITHLIVSSPATRDIYAGCFGVPESKVRVMGLPRTDAFFKPGFAKEARTVLEKDFPSLIGKTLVLYAPTFRDDKRNERRQIDIIRSFADSFVREMPDDYCLGLRLHPFVASMLKQTTALNSASKKDPAVSGRIIDLSNYTGLNTLLGSTDILITDYSSIIFEYSLLRRPMYFYAYDLDRFEGSDRGFYRDYRGYVPGPVFTEADGLLTALKASAAPDSPSMQNSASAIDAFIADSYSFTDGHSAERLLKLLIS
ncbi:MAG: CDP-glycerol glycerophosphotransferase family protein [Lachnospiraceae bacterium]|nr:CDP-glycerol glycerophosphotransferase family protein [Lachnospiraceae bacterium]